MTVYADEAFLLNGAVDYLLLVCAAKLGGGRILRLRLNEQGVEKCTVVADHMEHPNGIRIKGDYMYVTQSCMVNQKTESGKMMSCV